MSINDTKNVANEIAIIATRLSNRGYAGALELRRIAQFIKESPLGDGESKMTVKHSPEADKAPVADFKDEVVSPEETEDVVGDIDESSPDLEVTPDENADGAIGDFNDNQDPNALNDKKTHTLTVTLKAPANITEAKMMNYVLGIGPKMGVDVGSFKWSKSEEKDAEQPIQVGQQTETVKATYSLNGMQRYAQFLDGIASDYGNFMNEPENGTNMNSNFGIQDFNAGMNNGFNVNTFADEKEDPTATEQKPPIDSFVQMPEEAHEEVDDRKTHTCTVTFKAPEEVSEAEMMNYILGIGKQLKVDVDSFKWSKQDIRPAGGSK